MMRSIGCSLLLGFSGSCYMYSSDVNDAGEMFPRTIQQFFAAAVPAFIAMLGVASIARARKSPPHGRWLMSAGLLAILHAALTIVNLSVRGEVPFSSGATGWGPRYVEVDFVAYTALVGAVTAWAIAAIAPANEESPLAPLRRPFIALAAIGGAVVLIFFLLETFG